MIADPKKLSLKQDESGATIIEFALVSPVLLFMMMGSFDIGYGVYMRSVLDGAVQKAARDSALESGSSSLTTIDARVRETIQKVNKNAVVSFNRQSYHQYSDVDRPETFDDANGNGTCDNNELFGDENGNGDWDDDVGTSGVGGPKDVVYYTVTVAYDQLFPFKGFERNASQRVLTGYNEKTVPNMVRVPTEWQQAEVPLYKTLPAKIETVRIPVYEKTPITGYREVKLPIYKMQKVKAGKRAMLVPQYSVAGVFKRKVKLPQYRTVGATGYKTVKVPIYETDKIDSGVSEFQVPIYKVVQRTRSTSKAVAATQTVSVPIYRNVTYTEGGQQKVRRELTGYKAIVRNLAATEARVATGDKTYWVRELTGFQTVRRSGQKVVKRLVGYQDVQRPIGGTREFVGYKEVERTVRVERKLLGYNTVMRPDVRVERVLQGYQTKKIPIGGERKLVGETTKRMVTSQQRVRIGTRTEMRPIKFKIVQRGTKKVKVPVYGSRDASFTLEALEKDRQLTASTVLRNQPYGDQANIATATLRCT